MQMLGLLPPEIVAETLRKAGEVYRANASKLGLARVGRLAAAVEAFTARLVPKRFKLRCSSGLSTLLLNPKKPW
jgi:hypothetical protein